MEDNDFYCKIEISVKPYLPMQHVQELTLEFRIHFCWMSFVSIYISKQEHE